MLCTRGRDEYRMIIGSGLIAKAFSQCLNTLDDICIYAAGVSNSGCSDLSEFEREQVRLLEAIQQQPAETLCVYFSTCSIYDPSLKDSPYVLHKIRMESLVKECDRYLILRLPQVVGRTPNPHTLLNYLFARIIRSERFTIWGGATRNIIDVEDVVRVASDLILVEGACNETIDIANTENYDILDIVKTMGTVVNRQPIFSIINKGNSYYIEASRISASLERCKLFFGVSYLEEVIRKYYGVHMS